MWFTLWQYVIPKNALRTKILTPTKQFWGMYVNLEGII